MCHIYSKWFVKAMNRVSMHTSYFDQFPCGMIIKLLSLVPYGQSLLLVQLMKSYKCNWLAAAHAKDQCKHVQGNF